MDAVLSITQRIAHIQSQLAEVRQVRPPVAGADRVLGVVRDGVVHAGGATATFAQALEQAIGTSSPATAGTASAGRLNAAGVPVDLAQYENGRIPASALAPVGGTGHTLWAPAAAAYEELSRAAARDGVTIGITDSYRSYAGQVDVAQRKGLYSQGGLAAVPGTSDHGWGRSLDLRLDGAALSWMRENAGAYGFVEDVPREPWHWTYTP